jgi:dihydrofolate reductase
VKERVTPKGVGIAFPRRRQPAAPTFPSRSTSHGSARPPTRSILRAPNAARTRIERGLRPSLVRKLKEAVGRDLTVGGAHLVTQAIAAGLVDAYQPFIISAVVGRGTRARPVSATALRDELTRAYQAAELAPGNASLA